MVGGDIYYPRRDTDAFPGQIFTWINETFPHPEHKLHNGALPATGTGFFAICLKEHLKYEDVDLVILEFDINDSTPGYSGRYYQRTCHACIFLLGARAILISSHLKKQSPPLLSVILSWHDGLSAA